MTSSPTSRINNRFEAQGMTGSYWQENLSERSTAIARTMTGSLNIVNSEAHLERALRQWADPRFADTGEWLHRFDAREVAVVGPDLQARILTEYEGSDGLPVAVFRKPTEYDLGWKNAFVLSLNKDGVFNEILAEKCRYILFPDPDIQVSLNLNPNDLRPLYLVPFPDDKVPYNIKINDKELTLGSDYSAGDGVLVFRENPHDLFPTGQFVVSNARQAIAHLMNYTLKSDNFSGSAAPIATYLREKTSIATLQAACATAAGLTVIPATSVIQSRFDRCVGSRYVCDTGVYDALYLHDRLAVGTSVPEGSVVGNGVRVTSGASYRVLDWSRGFDLGDLSPIPGVTIPDRMCRAEAYDSTGSKLHVRFDLGLPAAVADKFWAHVKFSEQTTGHYLNDVLGLASVGDAAFLNPLDFYFQHLLSNRAVIAELRLKNTGEQFRIRASAFLANEKMINSVLIVRDL